MIDNVRLQEVVSAVRTYWEARVQEESFAASVNGKEIGHSIAASVEERTTELLHTQCTDSRYERDAHGRKRQRSMGDIWLASRSIYNPVNIKTGEFEKGGQPNMVSMGKLLSCLLRDQIDSYHLLFIKFKLGTTVRCSVYFLLTSWIILIT